MNTSKILILLFLLIGLTACGVKTEEVITNSGNGETSITPQESEQEKGFVGYVMNKEKNRILVVDPKSEDYSASGGMSNYYPAKWFSNAPSDIKIGYKVEVWTDGGPENEPYPGQARAAKVSTFPPVKPEGAVLNESDVIRKALSSHGIDEYSVPVVQEIHFDSSLSIWTINILTQTRDDQVLSIQVEDKS